MNFEDAINEYQRVANELVTLRAKLRADEEEQGHREAMLWLDVTDNPEFTNDRKRKAAFEAQAANDDEYQDLLGAIQLQREAIARLEIDERVNRKWADYAIACVATA